MKNFFSATQEDALLIPTGPRRLMSEEMSLDSKDLEESNGIIPVENHNPKRRSSVITQHPNSSDGTHLPNRIIGSVRRKIIRPTVNKRRDSIAVISSSNNNDKYWSGSFTGYYYAYCLEISLEVLIIRIDRN